MKDNNTINGYIWLDSNQRKIQLIKNELSKTKSEKRIQVLVESLFEVFKQENTKFYQPKY